MDATLTHLPQSLKIYEAALEGLSRINEAIYRGDSSLPEIHAAGVRYRRERGEAWRHAVDVVGEGWGDCEDLAAARVGWLRARGGDRDARVIVKRTGPAMTHALVRRGNGVIEDPSKDLGMGTAQGAITMDGFTNEEIGWNPFRRAKAKPKKAAPRRASPPPRASTSSRATAPAARAAAVEARAGTPAARAAAADAEVRAVLQPQAAPMPAPTPLQSSTDAFEEEDYGDEYDDGEDFDEIGADPSSSVEISWVVERTDNGYRGTVRVPLDAGRMLLVSRTAPKKAEAKGKALSAASSVINNPAVAALIPPQAKFALNIVQSKQARAIAKKLLKLF